MLSSRKPDTEELLHNLILLIWIPDPWLPSSVGRGQDFWPSQWGLDVAAASCSTRSNDRRSSARLVWRCRRRTTGQRWWPPRGLTCSERSTRKTGLEIVREFPWTRVVLHGKDPRRSRRRPLPCPFPWLFYSIFKSLHWTMTFVFLQIRQRQLEVSRLHCCQKIKIKYWSIEKSIFKLSISNKLKNIIKYHLSCYCKNLKY